LPGDKSLAHRVVIIASISQGITCVKNFPMSDMCLNTLECMKNLGVKIKIINNKIFIHGCDLHGLKFYDKILHAHSGTGLKLLTGLLAGQKFNSRIKILFNRELDSMLEALKLMGAKIILNQDCLEIYSSNLVAIRYKMPKASAQLKSAILLASLYARGKTQILEKIKTRDHTENILNLFKANISRDKNLITCEPVDKLIKKQIILPGDISSGAFFIALALLIPGSHLVLNNILVNPRRMGFIRILCKMGAKIKISYLKKKYLNEKIADIEIFSSRLTGVIINSSQTVDMIDEVIIFCVVAIFARGTSIIQGVQELKFKETNRLENIFQEFSKLGVKIKIINNQIIIHGANKINLNLELDAHNDHRIAMSLYILRVITQNKLRIKNTSCISDSFPDFLNYLEALCFN